MTKVICNVRRSAIERRFIGLFVSRDPFPSMLLVNSARHGESRSRRRGAYQLFRVLLNLLLINLKSVTWSDAIFLLVGVQHTAMPLV